MGIFGTKIKGREYRTRTGVYALMVDDQGFVVLVGRVDSDLHELPGGGLESGESHEEGLSRELREELGWSIQVGSYLGMAVQYTTMSPSGRYYKLEGHFYTAKKLQEISGKIEDDHEERRLSFPDAIRKVKYEYQRWAIGLFEKHLAT